MGSCRSEVTRGVYATRFTRFLGWYKVKDADLLRKEPKELQQQIINFISEEKERGLSYKSLASYLSAIKHFFESNDFDGINWKRVQKHLPEHKRVVKDRAYTLEELRAMLIKADERKRVVILLMASAGLRVGAIPALKVRDLQKVDDGQLYKITVYSGTDDEYWTACTPECAMVIDQYLDYRRRCGESIKPDAPLVREQFPKDDKQAAQQPKQVSLPTINYLVREILIDAGIRSRDTHNIHVRHEVAGNHGFRKWWNTQMIRAGVKPIIKEILIGHKVIGLESSYYRPTEQELLQEFTKAIDHLTIFTENKLKMEVEELQKKFSEASQLRNELESERQQRRQLQEQMSFTIGYLMETDPAKKAEISRRLIENGRYLPK